MSVPERRLPALLGHALPDMAGTRLDLQALREAAQRFEGTHDFAAFASKDPSKTPDQQRDTATAGFLGLAPGCFSSTLASVHCSYPQIKS